MGFAPRMMPWVLDWLYAPDLEQQDRMYTSQRKLDQNEYEQEAAKELEQANADTLFNNLPEFQEMASLVKRQSERGKQGWFQPDKSEVVWLLATIGIFLPVGFWASLVSDTHIHI